MECPNCKRPVSVAVSTCPHCGAEIMKICPECKNYVRAELEHCPSCGASLISLDEAARTVRTQIEEQAEPGKVPPKAASRPGPGAGRPAAPGKPTRGIRKAGLQTLPRPSRNTLIGLAVLLAVYGGLIIAAALFLRSLEPVPPLVLGTILGGAVGTLLGLGKTLAGLPPRQDDIRMDLLPALAAGAFAGLFLSFFGLQENLLAPEVLLTAAAGAVVGVLFSLAFSWGGGPEAARGIRGIIGNPVVGLLLGLCLGIGAMIGLGNLVFQMRRPGA